MQTRKISLSHILLLQLGVVIYTCAGILGKLASSYELFSVPFLALYAGEILVLAIYAVLWQQMIARVELSVAYANRGMSLLWSSLWAVLLFSEYLSPQNLLGIAVVTAGIILINSESSPKEVHDES